MEIEQKDEAKALGEVPTIKLSSTSDFFDNYENKALINSVGAYYEYITKIGQSPYKIKSHIGVNNIGIDCEDTSDNKFSSATLYVDDGTASLDLELYENEPNDIGIYSTKNFLRINAYEDGRVAIESQSGGQIFLEHNLYENLSGTSGTVILYEPIYDFKYIEIFYGDLGSTYGNKSVKVYSPNGATANLQLNTYTNGYEYEATSQVQIAGETITPLQSYRIRTKSSDGTITITEKSTVLKIYKVIGYR